MWQGVAGASCSFSAAPGGGRKEPESLASLGHAEAVGRAPTDIPGVAEVCHNVHPNYADVLIILQKLSWYLKSPYSEHSCLWLAVL